MTQLRVVLLYGVAALTAFASTFFVFYTVRLLYVTEGLTKVNAQGLYVGAVAFPLLALGFGWLTWRCLKSARRRS
ncbi:MAG: hypothetical protein JNL09_06795 [Anaerolineales bacterium]|nr:hypothetical protein [Anaerolineales bacterium]